MKIKDVREIEATAKGLVVVGKVAKIFDGKVVQGTDKNGKAYKTVYTSISLKDDTGDIYVSFANVDDDFLALEGEIISCISCSINEYVDKQGVTQRSLRASSYSADVIPETSQPELPEVQLEDPAHPVLPKTVPVKEESPVVNKPAEIAKPQVEPSTWDLKDLKIIRQNSNQHATALVCKYFKGTLDEAIAQVIIASNILVSSVYQGLKFPINNKQADIPHNEKQADLLKGIKAGSDKKVHESELDQLDVKALEYKKQLYTLSGDDIEYGWILKEYDIDQPHDIKDPEKKAELVSKLANKVIKLQKGE